MKFSSLIKINSLIKTCNVQRYGDKFELLLPHMHRDGQWSCMIVFGSCPDKRDVMPFLDWLNSENVYWWFSSLRGNIAICVQ